MMKKRIIFMCVAAAAVLMTSCFGRGNRNDRAAEETADAAELAAQPAVVSFTATATGVGPIQWKMAASDLPSASEGLYDAVEPYTEVLNFEGEESSYNRLRLMLGGTPVAIATNYDGKLGTVEIVAPNVASPEGVAPGMPVARLLEAGPTEWFNQDGLLYCKLGELMFRVSNTLSDSGWQKINAASALTAGDFADGSKVEAIVYF